MTLFDTDLSHLNVLTDNSMIAQENQKLSMNESVFEDEQIDPMDRAQVDPMEVYYDLQDEKKRLVLTNIRQFDEEDYDETNMTDSEYLKMTREI